MKADDSNREHTRDDKKVPADAGSDHQREAHSEGEEPAQRGDGLYVRQLCEHDVLANEKLPAACQEQVASAC